MSVSGQELFDEKDRALLAARGISATEGRRQIDLLRAPPRYADLDRPCTLGDGLLRLDKEAEELVEIGRDAAAAGRCLKFVPASGAATRMFRELLAWRRESGTASGASLRRAAAAGNATAAVVARFLDGLPRLALQEELEVELRRRGEELMALLQRDDPLPILDALLQEEGLAYASRPKALLPFHRYAAGSRTAFEEHLEEAAELVRDAEGICRLHFTVSPEHETGYRTLLGAARRRLEAERGLRLEVGFSVQKPSTDTLAVDLQNRLFRGPDGRLLFRAAGHGALVENLQELGADLVLIKNVDNVAPDRLKDETFQSSRMLLGLLVRVQDRSFALLRRLQEEDGAAQEEAASFLREVLQIEPPAPGASDRRRRLQEVLDRPARICGMVRNEGEPGGGPFWVREGGTLSRQIVESAQVDPGSVEQLQRFASGTHFNPVFLACGVRDHRGRPFDLRRYLDPEAVLVARRSAGGRELKALERPGLWNGAMARWNTLFVEVPILVFNPVKSVLDLLRDQHLAQREAVT